jgi:hypothetical protein
MLALKRLNLSWNPSQLILTGEYELGFQAAYIGRWGELEPSDQIDFDLW